MDEKVTAHRLKGLFELACGVMMSPQDERDLREAGVDPEEVRRICREKLQRIAEGKRDD